MAKTRAGGTRALAAILPVLVLGAACAAHLRNAKSAYAEAQWFARAYRTEAAIAAYKRARDEAALEARRRPSAQAFMLQGLAEVSLGLWRDAEQSLLRASGHGFEAGEAWAADVSILGLAISFEELGLGESAYRAYENLLGRSGFKPVRLAAAQRYFDLTLALTLGLGDKEKGRALADLAKIVDRL